MTARERERELWTGRDWGLDLRLDPEQHTRVVESVLLGQTDLSVKTEHASVLLCALPKSASLYTTQFLALCFGLANHQIGFDRAGGTIHYPRLLAARFRGQGTISHGHAAPDPATRRLIEALDLRTLVLTRDRRANGLLSARAMRRYLEAGEDEQLHTVITLFAPDYLNFLAGWTELAQSGELRPVFVSYEEITRDDVRTVLRLGAELGLHASEERVVEVRDRIRSLGGINLARGVSGRGAERFRPEHEARLRELAARLGGERLVDEPALSR